MPLSGTLNGKRVLVTGAAHRIGRALALAAALAGADVVIHYHHSPGEAQSVQFEIEQMGRRTMLLQADLSDPNQASGLVDRARQAGPLYALVNSAAVFAPLTWQDSRAEDWNAHLALNLVAPFLLSQAFARGLAQDAHGRIVNLLDWRALRPGPDHLPYTVSKAALAALTRSLAVALAPRVSVNGLALGAILPPSEGSMPPSAGAGDSAILQKVPAQRWGTLDEVGQALVFLLGGPEYVTGQVLYVDGGRHLL
jgi:NAD(P)-dependent dehydrogenase (short-subunit alcohol dehydrogenase family)